MKLKINLRNNGDLLASATNEVRDPLRCTEELLQAISKAQWMLAEGDTIEIVSAD
jgi:hypothetical protein